MLNSEAGHAKALVSLDRSTRLDLAKLKRTTLDTDNIGRIWQQFGILCKSRFARVTNTCGTRTGFALRRSFVVEENQTAIFTQWLEEHSASVIKVARAYTLTSEECQDLAQEILLQAWRSVPSFEGRASAATWFYRVALHTAMNWQRSDRPRRMSQKPLLEIHAPVADENSAEQVEHREILDQLFDAIHQLPSTDAALVLLYLDELSYREMADVLGITESNVGVRLNRAKKMLSTLMKGVPDGT